MSQGAARKPPSRLGGTATLGKQLAPAIARTPRRDGAGASWSGGATAFPSKLPRLFGRRADLGALAGALARDLDEVFAEDVPF
jgi:hypothetical protein